MARTARMTATGRTAPTDSQPAPDPVLFVQHTRTPAETAALGARIAVLARPGDLICLQGDLGCGKTVLARGFVRALAGEGVEVPSPTFNILLTYPAQPAPVWHFDLYRVGDPEELWELGLDEAFAEGVSLVEWPDRLAGMTLPPPLRLCLEALPDGGRGEVRRITGSGGGDWPQRLHRAGLG